MTAEICQWELEYFGLVQGRDCATVTEFYRNLLAKVQAAPPDTAYLSIGRGAGWHKLTPGIRVAKHLSQPEFGEFRKRYGLAAVDDFRLQRDPRLARFDRRDFVFPKSRKVVAEGDRAAAPLGWVQLVFREGQPPARLLGPLSTTAKPTAGPEVLAVREETRPAAPAPLAPQRNPHVVEAETLIRALKSHDIKSRLQAVAAAIGRCPSEERDRLVALFRARQEEMKLKAKDTKANMESLAERLKVIPKAGE
jgi:hypothetical protein